jgi:hypothetical protein
VPKWVLVVPTLWAVMGGISAPVNYGIREDLGLLVAGVLGAGLLLWRDRHASRPTSLQPRYTDFEGPSAHIGECAPKIQQKPAATGAATLNGNYRNIS